MKEELSERVINYMLKGISGVMTDQQKADFRAKYYDLANEVMLLLIPNPSRVYSPAIGAAITKCAIKYGKEKAFKLLQTMKDGTFNGLNDPARLLHLLIKTNKDFNNEQLYNKTVCAARAYCENRTLTELRYAKTDVFRWSEIDPVFSWDKKQSQSPVAESRQDVNLAYRADHFRIFFKDGDWIVHRKFETLQLCKDGHVNVISKNTRKDSKPYVPVVREKLQGEWYSTEQAGKELGRHGSTIREACLENRIPGACKFKGKWKIPVEEVTKLKQALTTKLKQALTTS
jgi:hypothetical protein